MPIISVISNENNRWKRGGKSKHKQKTRETGA